MLIVGDFVDELLFDDELRFVDEPRFIDGPRFVDEPLLVDEPQLVDEPRVVDEPRLADVSYSMSPNPAMATVAIAAVTAAASSWLLLWPALWCVLPAGGLPTCDRCCLNAPAFRGVGSYSGRLPDM